MSAAKGDEAAFDRRVHMTESLIILTAYPLSAAFQEKVIRAIGGGAQIVTVAQLRSAGMFRLLSTLWSMRVELIALPIEEENSAALLPVLKLLAACTRARRICVIHSDLRIETVTRWSIARQGVRFALASVACFWAAWVSKRELTRLLSLPRQEVTPAPNGGSVLYLKTNLWFGIKAGGSVGHIAGVVNGMQRRGHPVTFASAEPPVMIDEGVTFVQVAPPSAFGVPYELNNYRFQSTFKKALVQNPALSHNAIIYQRLSAANYLGAVLSIERKLPLVVEYNGSEVWVAKNWGRAMKFHKLAEMAEEVMLRHAQLIVTVSDVLRDELVSRGVEPQRIVSYPNCIDPQVFDPERFSDEARNALRAQLGISSAATVITFVGTFGQWHGAEKLAEAIAKLQTEQPDWLDANRIHFLFVGDGLTRPNVIDTVSRASAQQRCTFAGLVPQPDAPLYLAASDILVSPHVANADGSRFFGSPTKLFEYMAMGKPIIASALEQIADVLQPALHTAKVPVLAPVGGNYEVALLTPPGAVDDLIEGIKFLVAKPGWQSVLGQNAKAMALEKYTWDRHVLEILKALPREEGK